MKVTARTRLHSHLNSAVMVILIVCLATLAGWLSTRYQWQADWTRNGRHTLNEASRLVLEKMDGPIEITAYAREDTYLRDVIRKFVARYQRIKPEIKLHFVNPDAVPDEVRTLGVSVHGELVVRYRGRSQHVQSENEEEFTNALQRLTRAAEHWLAFVEGHGERGALGQANFDLTLWVQQLTNRGFKAQPLDLANTQTIPENTRVLVIAGPQVDYLPGELEIITDFIDRGGNLLWLLDPPGALHNLDALAAKLHINITSGTIIDFAGRLLGLDDPTIALATSSLYPPHPITRDFSYTTLYPSATAIMTDANDIWQARPFIATGDHTWLETGELDGDVNYDEGADTVGPLDIGIGLEREIEFGQNGNVINKSQRIAIIGDGDFLSNAYVENSGNMDLGVRIMSWLSHDDDSIVIPARVAPDLHLELSPVAAVIVGFGFIIILPLILVSTGITIWWRRRKL